ncbi:MSC_0620 family F1-like ATPase-associated subunit [Mycoplasma sp. Ms02]|uniref:MSC_0620 family F1-like ATPase-associated subunit n=1 Tax=Mycoplasma sp. Ms02 TaxID=353851 RepID=UPI001C892345|nr:hypothetical protein [Mycoplasma sp. Ms02]QZE12326.1 hypothetical protein K4L35_03265 [Mycoplasma sp. Ms02]
MKIKKHLSKLLLLSATLSPLAIITVSATTTTVNTNLTEGAETPSSPEVPSTPEVPDVPRQVDPEFDSFAEKQNEMFKEAIGDFIDKSIATLNRRASELLDEKLSEESETGLDIDVDPNSPDAPDRPESDEEKPEFDVHKNLSKALYYKKVMSFLKSNKEEIIKNPNQFGLEVIFPKIIGREQEYNFGTITIGKNEFSNIIIGKTDETDYAAQVAKRSGTIEKQEEPTQNFINQEELLKQTSSYFKDALSRYRDILVNVDDMPVVNDNTSWVLPEDAISPDLSVPAGYSTWDEYVKEKISDRWLQYDIQKNQEYNEQEPEPTPTPPEPPIVLPSEDPIDDPFEDLTEAIKSKPENIPRLNAKLSYRDYNVETTRILGKYSENTERFWFKNPINTRYKYNVTEVRNQNGKLVVDAIIKDTVKPDSQGSYITDLTKRQKYTKNHAAAEQLASRKIELTYLKFYKALGLDEKIQVTKLGSQELAQTVFNMVFQTLRITESKDFDSLLNGLIEQYYQSIQSMDAPSFEKLYEANESSEFLRKVEILFLSAIRLSTINNIGYWSNLAETFGNVFDKFVERAKSISKTVEFNFKQANFDIEKYEQGLKVLKLDIDKLKGEAIFSSLDATSEYSRLLVLIEKIQKQFLNLAYLTEDKQVDFKTENEVRARFEKGYKELSLSQYEQPNTNKKLIAKVALFFGLISGLLLAATALFIRLSKKKIIKDKKKPIAIASIMGVTLIATIVMVVLGLGGL